MTTLRLWLRVAQPHKPRAKPAGLVRHNLKGDDGPTRPAHSIQNQETA
jgi:hypothetical protein